MIFVAIGALRVKLLPARVSANFLDPDYTEARLTNTKKTEQWKEKGNPKYSRMEERNGYVSKAR